MLPLLCRHLLSLPLLHFGWICHVFWSMWWQSWLHSFEKYATPLTNMFISLWCTLLFHVGNLIFKFNLLIFLRVSHCNTWNVLSLVLLVCKQANRALRQATLGTLNSLIVAYGDKIVLSAYEVIIVELSGLIRFVLLAYFLHIGNRWYGIIDSIFCCLILLLVFQWFWLAHDSSCPGTLLHINGW